MKNENLYQTIIAAIVIIVAGVLAYHGTLDSGAFVSLVTLILGYVFGRSVGKVANGG